jgi:hypothetical protein
LDEAVYIDMLFLRRGNDGADMTFSAGLGFVGRVD